MTYIVGFVCALGARAAWGHGLEMSLGSTASGSGALALGYDFSDPADLTELSSIGGMTVYASEFPGFEWLQQDEPGEGLYALAVGTPFSITITAIELGASVKISNSQGSTTLAALNDSAFVANTTDVPEDHFHPQWQLILPDGVIAQRSISFVLTTTSPAYSASIPYTLILTNAPEAEATPTETATATGSPQTEATATSTHPTEEATPTPTVETAATTTPSMAPEPTETPTVLGGATATPTLSPTPDPLASDANCDTCLTGADITALIHAVAIAPAPPTPACPSSGLPDGVSADEQIARIVHDLFNSPYAGCAATPVALHFRGVVGDQPFQCGQFYQGIGTTAQQFVPADFRLYIHNVRLVTPDGREAPVRLTQDGMWQYRDVALLDFEDKTRPCTNGTEETNGLVVGTAAPLTYTGVRFVLGLPFDLNHGDALAQPSPLNLSSMSWSWQAGHKFLRVDTFLDVFRIHVGSTGCDIGPGGVVSSCSRLNLAEVDLSGFDPATNVIAADLAAALADTDLSVNLPDTPPGCMSDPEDTDCEPIFRNLGINLSDGSPNPTSQKFFRVE